MNSTSTSARPRRRAALLLAAVGVVELLLSTCCVGGLLMTQPSLQELQQSPMGLPPGMTEEQLLTMVQGVQIVMAVVAVVLFLLPGVALIVLSPMVDRATPWALTAARIILWVHTVLVALALLLNVAVSILMLNVLSLLLNVLFLGGLLALQITTIRSLRDVQGVAGGATSGRWGDDDDDVEPWNSHLT